MFAAEVRKTENAVFERNNLQRVLRDLEENLKEKTGELSRMQQRYSNSFAEIAQLKMNSDSLQQHLDTVCSGIDLSVYSQYNLSFIEEKNKRNLIPRSC